MRFVAFVIFMLTHLVITGCASFTIEKPDAHVVTLQQNAFVKNINGEAVQKNAGDQLEVRNEPILIEAPGHVGVLVLPLGATPAKADVTLRPTSSWAGEATKQYAGMMLSEMLAEVNKIQRDLSRGNTQVAYTSAQALRRKYPQVSYLKFVEASCLVVMGQTTKARELLQQAIVEYPENEDAKRLYRSIGGREPASQ